jgi:hypothetical protein
MRIRSTKPEFWRSKTIAALPWDVRLVLKALESYVDDNGVGKDDIALIAADAFPRDLSASPPETLARLTEAISDLAEAGLIARYELDGEDLVYIDRWKELQRIDKPSRGRFRRPDGTLEYSEEVNRESYRRAPENFGSPPENFAPGTGEQGNRGTGEQTHSCASADAERERDDIAAEFEHWYESYPRKRGRGQALKAYKVARRKTNAETLLAAITQQAPTLMAKGAEYVPYPATWLNGERWADQPDAPPPPTQVRRLPYAHELELPPDGLSPAEYAAWEREQRERRKRA